MKKVLILAYDFPPYVSVGGLRPYAWYKYLREYGVEVTVITRNWNIKYKNYLDYVAPSISEDVEREATDYGTIIKAPYKANLANRLLLKYGKNRWVIIRRAITLFLELTQWIWLVGPKSSLYFVARNHLKINQPYDAIIASGDPFILFRYASLLSREFDIPWIADYRDPWVQDYSIGRSRILKAWNRFFEKKILRNVSCVTTVSNFLKLQISPNLSNVQFHILPNGYDPEAIDKARDIKQGNEKLGIALVGSILPWHPIENFLRVCSDFVEENKYPDFLISFYGVNIQPEIEELVEVKLKVLIPHIKFYPKIPNEELMPKLAKENVLLLFNNFSFMGTKIFDYLGIKRRIILYSSSEEEAIELKNRYYIVREVNSESNQLQADLIKETNSGIVVKDSQHLHSVLLDLYTEFKQKGFVRCNSKDTERFSRKFQVKVLSQIIYDVST